MTNLGQFDSYFFGDGLLNDARAGVAKAVGQRPAGLGSDARAEIAPNASASETDQGVGDRLGGLGGLGEIDATPARETRPTE